MKCYDCEKVAKLHKFNSSSNAVWSIKKEGVMLCKKCYQSWSNSETSDKKVWRAESGWAE